MRGKTTQNDARVLAMLRGVERDINQCLGMREATKELILDRSYKSHVCTGIHRSITALKGLRAVLRNVLSEEAYIKLITDTQEVENDE